MSNTPPDEERYPTPPPLPAPLAQANASEGVECLTTPQQLAVERVLERISITRDTEYRASQNRPGGCSSLVSEWQQPPWAPIRFGPDLGAYPRHDSFIVLEGGRGTGKTTTLLTLLDRIAKGQTAVTRSEAKQIEGEQLQTENASEKLHPNPALFDTVLNPIDPEMFNGDAEFVLSWVFAGMEELTSSLARVLDRDGKSPHGSDMTTEYNYLRPPLGLQLRECYQRVKETLALIGGRYRDRAIQLSHTRSDFTNEVFQVQQGGRELAMRIRAYFNTWFCCHDKVIQLVEGREKVCFPLLVIPFDDIDMADERSPKLLHMIHAYLRHPRVVVIILGSWDMFRWSLQQQRTQAVNQSLLRQDAAQDHFRQLSMQMAQKYVREENIFEIYVELSWARSQLRQALGELDKLLENSYGKKQEADAAPHTPESKPVSKLFERRYHLPTGCVIDPLGEQNKPANEKNNTTDKNNTADE